MTVEEIARETKEWLLSRLPKQRVGVLLAAKTRFKLTQHTLNTLEERGIVTATATGSQRRIDLDESNLARLIVAGRLVRELKWNFDDLHGPEFESCVRQATPVREGGVAAGGRRLLAETALQQMMANRLLRWLSGLLAAEGAQQLGSEDRFRVMYRFRRGSAVSVTTHEEPIAPRLLPTEVFTEWVTQPGPGAVIHVEGSTRPYDDRLSPNLYADPEVRDLIQNADRCFLYKLYDQFSHAEILFVCEHGSLRSPQPLTGRQVKTVLGLLRVLSALVRGFEEPVINAPAEAPQTEDSAMLRFFNQRMPGHHLASLARQLAHLPDHLINVSPGWAGAVIAVPNAEPFAIHDASQLNIVECSRNYSDLINRRMTFPTTERHSLSARAYREQQTRVEWHPSPENSLLYAEEKSTAAMAIPLGLGPYIGAKGSLFIFARGTHSENETLVRDTQPALEVLAHIIGQIIEAHLHQGWLFQECHLILMDEGQRDRLTRWQSATAFVDAVKVAGDLGMPVIMVHLLYPDVASAEMLAIALHLIDDLLREEAFLRRLRSLLKTPPGTPAEALYTGYVLDRSTQAIIMNPGLGFDDETFYAVKTAIAKTLRSVRFDGRPDRPNFAWVRAAITHGAVCEDCCSLGVIPCVVQEQQQLFECVQELHTAIANHQYGDAFACLDRLQATSPSSRLPNWSCEDPSLNFERGRVSAMEAVTMRDVSGLERAVRLFGRMPRSCWTGSSIREWSFALKTLAEWRLWNILAARAGPDSVWEDESAKVMSLCAQARDLLEGGCSVQETPPTRGTIREMMRMLQDVEIIEDRARALDAIWRT